MRCVISAYTSCAPVFNVVLWGISKQRYVCILRGMLLLLETQIFAQYAFVSIAENPSTLQHICTPRPLLAEPDTIITATRWVTPTQSPLQQQQHPAHHQKSRHQAAQAQAQPTHITHAAPTPAASAAPPPHQQPASTPQQVSPVLQVAV